MRTGSPRSARTYSTPGGYRPIALDVLAVDGDRIAAVTAFRTPAIFPRFGLPEAA